VSSPRKKRGGSGSRNRKRRPGGGNMENTAVAVEEAPPANGAAESKSIEQIKAELEQQRDERIRYICDADPMLREIVGALKGLDYAIENK
tara:strand:- start:2654 stop:2923 length:270 start_codon:yes stop_codon:yes gene_type:complete